MSNLITKRKQFNVIFFAEMWERYAFYGFQTLFILFITYEKLPQSKAYMIFGIFTALLWMLPTFGGALADRVFGIKRSLIFGGVVFALGYLLLAFTTHFNAVIVALSLIALGNGFFKPTPSALVSKIYNDSASESKAAFTLYYMSINIGGLAATIIAPIIALHTSYSTAFSLSAIGMLLGLSNFLFKLKLFKNIDNKIGNQPFSIALASKMFIITICLFAINIFLLHFLNISFYLTLGVSIIVFIYLLISGKNSESVSERFKHYVGLILIIESIAFFIIYNQIFSTFILFAKNNMNLSLFGFQFSPGNIVLFDPIGIIIFSPIIAKIYHLLARKNINVIIPYKFSIGQIFAGLSVLVLALMTILFSKQGYLNISWMAVVFIFFTIGEILISALGLSMVALYFRQKIISFTMGVWFLAIAVAGVLTGKFAQLFATIPKSANTEQSLHLYIHYFVALGVISIAIGILYFIIAWTIQNIAKHKAIIID